MSHSCLSQIVKFISDEYNINYSDILDRINNKYIQKKRPIKPSNFCLARKPNFEQCTRNKKNNSDFCANHQYYHPNGRIDEENTTTINYIKLKPIELFNTAYFIDKNNHLYSKINDKYSYIGDYDKINNIIVKKKLKN
jgi:hypothetical protein